MNIKAIRLAALYFSLLLFMNCSDAQNVIEISAGVKLKQLGQELTGSEVDDEFGRRVAINESGTIIIVAAREADQAFVYQLASGKWKQLGQTLSCAHCRWFGFEVDIADDGKTVAVGSESEGVYIFAYKNGTWVPKGEPLLPNKYGYGIGRTLELSGSGDLIAVTAYAATSKEGVVEAGAAYVLEFKNGAWVQKGNALYGDLAGQQMGYAMGFSRDGKRLVIASPYHSFRSTKAYQFDGKTWKQLGSDINPKEKKDGWRIRMNDEGNEILAYNGTKRIYLHSYQDGDWEAVRFQEGNTRFVQDYGYGFEFVSASDLLLVSNPALEDAEQGVGEIFFFDLQKKDNLQPIGSLKGDNHKNYFGYELDVSSDGKKLVIGSMGIDEKGLGSVKVFELVVDKK